ncbi:AraC family transcriptional regulator [Viscerimonas tarda]
MIDFRLYLAMLAMLIPVFTAGTCMILAAFSRMNCLTRQEKTLKTILVLYLSMTFLTWFTIFCYYIFPKAFVVLNIPCLAGFILAPLFFYRVIRFLTRLEQAEQFSPWHYLLPALIGATFLLWSLFVPFEAQVEIVASRKLVVAGEYEAYSRFFTTKPLLRMLFVFVYYGFIARLLVRYYRRTNDADVPVRKPARWMVYLIVLSLVSVFSSVISALLPRNEILASVWTAVTAFCMSGQFIALTFHIVRRRYLPYAVHPEPEEEVETKEEIEKSEESGEQEDDRRFHSGKLTRRRVNAYFRKEKPYLQADFKITDLAEAMDVNRAVMSGFINKAYKMNFNRFLNLWRLRELERLQALPSNRGKSIAKLIGRAGFTEERQYYRAKRSEL